MSQRVHVALLHREHIDAILSGKKTIESRFSRTRRAPLHAVSPGDVVYFKQTSGGYRASARVKRVQFHEGLSSGDIQSLRRSLNDRVLGGRAYWTSKRDSRYATLIWLDDVRALASGPSISRQYGNAWVINRLARRLT